MLDIKFIRENVELVKDNMKKKNLSDKVSYVDEVLKLSDKWKETKQKIDQLRSERNRLSQEVNKAKKEGKDIKPILKEVSEIPSKISKLEESLSKFQENIDELLIGIPNIMHKDVPIGKDESENVVVKVYGKPKEPKGEVKSHVEILENLGLADFELSSKTSGKGFYYLLGDIALLNQAILRYAIDMMVSKGFTYVETPLMLRGSVIKNVTDLNDMQNQIYKIEDEDLYLIGTSEHSLIGRFIDSIIPESKLPILNTSYSMCFRKEIGSHGIDEKGLFRTHQFNKIEMIVICKPSESMKYYEEMKSITVEIFKSLKIPIRVLQICSGDLGSLKHIQVDIEAYSPRKKGYFEVGSCSNLTDCQARKLKIRVSGNEKYVPHTLNNTAVATSRALVAIIENNVQKDGTIKVPEVLLPYMNGKKVIGKNSS